MKWMKVVKGRCRLFILDWEDAVLPKGSRAAEIINTYADEIQGAGYDFAVYTGLSWYNSYLRKYADKLPYEFWIARYYAGYKAFTTSDPVNTKYIPAITHKLIGWQYTSNGQVSGVKGSVDINQWYKELSGIHSDKTIRFQNQCRILVLGAVGKELNGYNGICGVLGFCLRMGYQTKPK